MNLQQQWRARAAEIEQTLPALIRIEGVNKDQAAIVHALAMRELLPALADMLDIIERTRAPTELAARLGRLAARNNRVRMAATQALSTGDWSEFSRILDQQLADAGEPATVDVAPGGTPAG